MKIAVKDIKAGDEFYNSPGKLGWTAVKDAEQADGLITCEIRHVDGGLAERFWCDPDREIEVTR